jgi:hypothetical protein
VSENAVSMSIQRRRAGAVVRQTTLVASARSHASANLVFDI